MQRATHAAKARIIQGLGGESGLLFIWVVGFSVQKRGAGQGRRAILRVNSANGKELSGGGRKIFSYWGPAQAQMGAKYVAHFDVQHHAQVLLP